MGGEIDSDKRARQAGEPIRDYWDSDITEPAPELGNGPCRIKVTVTVHFRDLESSGICEVYRGWKTTPCASCENIHCWLNTETGKVPAIVFVVFQQDGGRQLVRAVYGSKEDAEALVARRAAVLDYQITERLLQ
jgi:hypothetical protein